MKSIKCSAIEVCPPMLMLPPVAGLTLLCPAGAGDTLVAAAATVAEEVRKDRTKETKNDTTIELAALLHDVSDAT